MHGAPKVGKTTVASSFPVPLFFATESGHRYIPDSQRKILQRLTYDKQKVKHKGKQKTLFNGWEKLILMLECNVIEKSQCKTVVLDTTAPLYHMCMDYYCNKEGIEHPEDQSHGKGWAGIKREYIRGLGMIASQAETCGATTLFITHSRQDELKAGNRTYNRIVSDMTGQARSVVMPAPDHIWYLGFHSDEENSLLAFKQNRALWLKPTPTIEAGCRDSSHTVNLIYPLNETDQYQQILKELRKHQAKRKAV